MNRFDKTINRRNTNSVKWNVADNELPMWVADMDFETAPEIIDALHKRVDHGVFGYTTVPDKWYQSIIDWNNTRYNFSIDCGNLVFSPGVIPALSNIFKALTKEQDKILVISPAYNAFFKVIENNNRIVVENNLIYENQQYQLDLELLEQQLKEENISLLILCNPHNPLGIIWEENHLIEIGRLCSKYQVLVVADEIHGDLTLNQKTYTPFASINQVNRDISITCIAPTKTFNLAGLHSSALIIFNPQIYKLVSDQINIDDVALAGCFAIEGTIAAYNHGSKWLESLKAYLTANKQITKEYIANNIPKLSVVGGDATYLEWIDCCKVTDDSQHFANHLRQSTGLFVSNGVQYRGNGHYFIRLNLATNRKTLIEGLERLKTGVESYQK